MIELLENRWLLSSYFVDATNGSDGNSGRSAKLAWQSLATVDAHAFKKGDTILLTGTFSNQMLTLGPNAAGVTVNAYAVNPANGRVKTGVAGAATITVSTTDAIQISASKVTVENINLSSTAFSDGSANYTSGVHLINNGSTPFTNETINQVTATGFSYAGLSMQGWNTSAADSAGFSNVLIENSTFFSNGISGFYVGAGDNTGQNFAPGFPDSLYLNSNLTIKNCQAFDNAGYNPAFASLPDTDNPNDGNATSGGIFISSVNNATVQNSTAYDNGFASSNSVGIWAFDATRVNFISDQSYDNTTTNQDGDGFDFDHGTTNSIMQYDYSHGNDGAGFLITTNGGISNNNNLTLRNNISDDDGQQNSYGGITLYAPAGVPILNSNIYNNTILSGNSRAGTPSAVQIMGDGISSSTINILNNIFFTAGSAPQLDVEANSSSILFAGNDYWSPDSATHFTANWADSSYTSLTDFQGATEQEMIAGKSVGQNEDPGLTSETVSDLMIPNIAQLTKIPLNVAKTSALRKQGLNLTTRAFKVSSFATGAPYNLAGTAWGGIGRRDFFNHAIDRTAIGAG